MLNYYLKGDKNLTLELIKKLYLNASIITAIIEFIMWYKANIAKLNILEPKK